MFILQHKITTAKFFNSLLLGTNFKCTPCCKDAYFWDIGKKLKNPPWFYFLFNRKIRFWLFTTSKFLITVIRLCLINFSLKNLKLKFGRKRLEENAIFPRLYSAHSLDWVIWCFCTYLHNHTTLNSFTIIFLNVCVDSLSMNLNYST